MPDGNVEPIGERIRRLRDELGMTQGELADSMREVADTRTTGQAVSDWERGEVAVSGQTLAAMAMLTANPLATLTWLRNGGTMPRIHVHSHEPLDGSGGDADHLERLAQRLLRGAAALRQIDEAVSSRLDAEAVEASRRRQEKDRQPDDQRDHGT